MQLVVDLTNTYGSSSTMRFIHINEYEYMNNYHGTYNIQFYTHVFAFLSLSCVHTLQHLNNHIDVTKMQVKGLIFSRPPAMYDV